jgi:drug/metabolite transporter (DMT)-like permease
MNSPALRMGSREWGLLLILSVIWGSSFYFFKVLVTQLPPLSIVLGRVALASVALNLLLRARGIKIPTRWDTWRRFMVMGAINNIVPFTLIVFGETRISSGLASILNATTPIFAVLTAHWLTANEKLTANKIAGVCFGLLGVALLVGPGALLRDSGFDLLGEVACLGAALSYALAGIYGRRFKELAPLQVATGQITASTLILIPITCLVDKPWMLPSPNAHGWYALIALALLCTAVAYVIYFRILAVAGATNLMLVTFLLPISALLLGAIFLNESITVQAIGGMALIGFGLAAIDGRIPAALRRQWS